MPSCSIIGCTNRSTTNPGLRFYNIPSGPHPFQVNRRKLWLHAIKDRWSQVWKYSRICGAHFISGKPSMDWDSPDFVPSIFTETRKNTSSKRKKKIERHEGKRKRDSNQRCHTPKPAKRKMKVDNHDTIPHINIVKKPSVEQSRASEFIPKTPLHKMKLPDDRVDTDHVNLEQDFLALKKTLEMQTFSCNSLTDDTERLTFFTGLTSHSMFHWLLNICKQNIHLVSQKLSVEDHLLLVLTKLRLGLSNSDIAYRFCIPVSSVCRILQTCLPVLSAVLKPLLKWPSKEAVQENMPAVFKKNFCKCRCILDLMEIFIDCPTNLTGTAEKASNCKHNYIIKYLVGITPDGAVSFLSRGWGGRVSDKQLTVESGFLDLLEQGDDILADRDFLVRDELAAHGATLKWTKFPNDKEEMSGQEADSSMQFSSVQIHVERVLGWWKKFKILQSIIPIAQADLLDDIVIVCGGLTNICATFITKE